LTAAIGTITAATIKALENSVFLPDFQRSRRLQLKDDLMAMLLKNEPLSH
jgi:hypothetical protein